MKPLGGKYLQMRVEGFEALDRALAQLPLALQRRVVGQALETALVGPGLA